MTPPNHASHFPTLCTLLTVGWLGAGAMSASAGETEWPQFRGPTGQGLSQATGVPTQWSATEGVAWKVEVPGRGWSSPVLSKDRLYLTSAVQDAGGGDTTLHALCLDSK